MMVLWHKFNISQEIWPPAVREVTKSNSWQGWGEGQALHCQEQKSHRSSYKRSTDTTKPSITNTLDSRNRIWSQTRATGLPEPFFFYKCPNLYLYRKIFGWKYSQPIRDSKKNMKIQLNLQIHKIRFSCLRWKKECKMRIKADIFPEGWSQSNLNDPYVHYYRSLSLLS